LLISLHELLLVATNLAQSTLIFYLSAIFV
jgi:hypothetical protein